MIFRLRLGGGLAIGSYGSWFRSSNKMLKAKKMVKCFEEVLAPCI